jgi:polysaccharide pyruvyl transferase WcaK-like protein/SAM-dependent methyltransferase
MGFSTEMPHENAHQVNTSNPFYSKRPIISVYDLERIQSPDVVIVGGGDLSGLYGMQQVLKAKESGRAAIVARIGTSAKDDFLKGGKKAVDLVRASIKVFDYISVRDKASQNVLDGLGVKSHLGADLAIDMYSDYEYQLPKHPYAILVVREVRDGDATRQINLAKKLYDTMSKEFQSVVVLPFCAGDEVFSDYFTKSCKNATVLKSIWRDPAKVNWVIKNSQYVVSAGRLHPLVFAIGNRRPCYAVTYPWLSGYDKINGMMHHAGIGHRVVDWGVPHEEIDIRLKEAITSAQADQEIINAYSGHLKGWMLQSLCPVLTAMGAQHGVGVDQGMKAGQFKPNDYDENYYFGARLFRQPHGEFMVYHPSRGDWEGWDVIRDLIMEKMKPESLLDIGCGRGWFLSRMVDAGIEAQGIDMSTAAWMHSAPGMQKHIKIGELGDIRHRRFDVVAVFDVMEHIFEEDIADAIKALKESAGKYIVFNICASPDNENIHTIKKGQPVSQEMEWLGVSGHVTIRYRSWWKARLEDDDWESDEEMTNEWFGHPSFRFSSWARHNTIILRRRRAAS